MSGKLTDTKVRSEKKPGRYGDGNGLWLQVARGGSKSFLLRFMIAGKAREMGLGSVSKYTLKESRERAREFRQQIDNGIDPIEARREAKMAKAAEAAKRISFEDAAMEYISAHQAEWTNEKHARQWTSTLKTHVYPVIGDLSVADIETAHVLKVLTPIWESRTETASRVRGRIEKVLDMAAVRGYRTGDNPARWRGHLSEALAKKSKIADVKHFAALPFEQVPAFMATLRGVGSVSARALEFTILAAVRTGETIGATWDEIDFASKVWTIPADHMKAGKEHRVPLSDRALEILVSLPRKENNLHVFIGNRKGKGLSQLAMLHVVKKIDYQQTVHGFRSSFRDWCGDQTNFPRDIAEAALAHKIPDRTEAAYRRGDALEKRRKMMAAWAGYCAMPQMTGNGVVTPMRKGA